MAKVLVEEQNLIDIADALRDRAAGSVLIAHEDTVVPVVKTSSTPNVVNKDVYTSDYGTNWEKYDVITIPGASSIEVELTYQTESNSYDYVQIMTGEVSSASGTKYGGTTKTTKTLTFSDTDTITIYFKSDISQSTYFGYYAVVTGYDADSNQVTASETNTFKPGDMAECILKLPSMATGSLNNIQIPCEVAGQWDVSDYIDSILIYGCYGIYTNGKTRLYMDYYVPADGKFYGQANGRVFYFPWTEDSPFSKVGTSSILSLDTDAMTITYSNAAVGDVLTLIYYQTV